MKTKINMKTTAIYNKLFTGLAFVIAAISISSCKKDTIDASGQFNIKVVNAAATSGAQSFTLAGNVLVSGGLNYTDASAYINAPSGKNMTMEFKNAGTSSVYASGSLYTTNGVNFTVYLAGQGSNARVKAYEDDLGAPNNGQVKIKFIHLSNNAPSVITIKNSSGDDLVTTLARDISSGYKYVSPGALSVQFFGTASRDNIGNFTVADLVAGKIYTLYLTDTATGGVILNKVLHN
ncbi:DUF4397 domain-containing protein [Mucilaginibacter polytrichastri]|uniref:DUF4397 domain-containing protein n=1 Tax=Mucilaginibacter polytrichastri TaxID=1302689 RepID=A0A1Q6A0I8_9SPHI|nr:DUF4397 domain-containing protein [Mucilaginibacter polytrichastri]OKS87492.1 hypothetical protein RG47T_2953 [Mucilaginibacter polytrichastri]SFS91322.1 protein of unknown function [Mucilaginibacter polytrichastri]